MMKTACYEGAAAIRRGGHGRGDPDWSDCPCLAREPHCPGAIADAKRTIRLPMEAIKPETVVTIRLNGDWTLDTKKTENSHERDDHEK